MAEPLLHLSHNRSALLRPNLNPIISEKPKRIKSSIRMADAGTPNLVIDLQDFSHWKLVEACEEWGFFRLANHGVPLPPMMEMKAVVRALLVLPSHVKLRNGYVIADIGYMAPSAVNPVYEALGLYDMASSHDVDDF